MTPIVRVYLITYRRPRLLERALRSLIAQTHSAWVAEVLNDAPDDHRVEELLAKLADDRIRLTDDLQHRGGTGNFNYAFRRVQEPLASILEDDNWWEPTFLETMVSTLADHPEVQLACGNERIWREQPDGQWVETGKSAWPAQSGKQLFTWSALDKCGGARLCNSSMVYRTAMAESWRTPTEIPVDVTEHFRERAVPHPLLLVSTPLVNYGQTLTTYRSEDISVWALYQLLLVGSVFELARPETRPTLAAALWQRAREKLPLTASTLLATGRNVPAASELWTQAHLSERFRFFASAVRHPRAWLRLRHACESHRTEWSWLLRGEFADFMARDATNGTGGAKASATVRSQASPSSLPTG